MKRSMLVASMFFLLTSMTAFAVPKNSNEFGDWRLVKIDDPVKVSFPSDPANLDRQKIRQAIAAGLSVKGWRTLQEADGRIDVTTTVNGKHVVNAQILYDNSSYQIKLVDSVNMLYREIPERNRTVRVIHKNYNVWIRDLSAAINSGIREPGRIVKDGAAATAGDAPALPDSGFAALNNVDAVPVRPEGKERYAHFLTLPLPRAFVVSQSGAWRFWYGSKNAAAKAVDYCQAQKTRCWLYAVDERVVWNADPEKRTPHPGQLAAGSE